MNLNVNKPVYFDCYFNNDICINSNCDINYNKDDCSLNIEQNNNKFGKMLRKITNLKQNLNFKSRIKTDSFRSSKFNQKPIITVIHDTVTKNNVKLLTNNEDEKLNCTLLDKNLYLLNVNRKIEETRSRSESRLTNSQLKPTAKKIKSESFHYLEVQKNICYKDKQLSKSNEASCNQKSCEKLKDNFYNNFLSGCNLDYNKMTVESLEKINKLSEKMNLSLIEKSSCNKNSLTENEETSLKIPSYIGISCAISGYSTYNKFYNNTSNTIKRLNDNNLLLKPNDLNGQYLNEDVSYVESYNSFKNGLKPRKIEEKPILKKCNLNLNLNNSFDENDNRSLIQKRIESLYGHNFANNWKENRSKLRMEKNLDDAFRSPSCPPEFINSFSGKKNLPVLKYLNNSVFNTSLVLESNSHKKITKQTKSEEKINFNDQEISLEEPKNNFENIKNNLNKLKLSFEEPKINFEEPKPNSEEPKLNLNKSNSISEEKLDSESVVDGCIFKQEKIEELNIFDNILERDGNWYLKKLADEVEKIERKKSEIEQIYLDENLKNRDEIEGKIRCSIGKANLLISSKLLQFQELCRSNINKNENEQFKTLNEDLTGFYDMVSFQINDVHKTFDEIIFLQKNGWVLHNDLLNNSPRHLKSSSKNTSKTNSRSNSKPSSTNSSREDLRKLRIKELKKKQQNQSNNHDDVLIFLPNKNEKKQIL